MQGKTHITVGMASSLIIIHPITIPGIVTAMIVLNIPFYGF